MGQEDPEGAITHCVSRSLQAGARIPVLEYEIAQGPWISGFMRLPRIFSLGLLEPLKETESLSAELSLGSGDSAIPASSLHAAQSKAEDR